MNQLRGRRIIVFSRTKQWNENGFTFIEVIYQLIILSLLMTLLPFVLSHSDHWRYTEGFHEEVEWEYVVNEVLKLVQQYDYYSPVSENNIRVSLYKEETIQNYEGNKQARADAYLTVANYSIILSKNTGTEPIVYSSMKFLFEPNEEGFTIKSYNESGEVKERYFYMRRILN